MKGSRFARVIIGVPGSTLASCRVHVRTKTLLAIRLRHSFCPPCNSRTHFLWPRFVGANRQPSNGCGSLLWLSIYSPPLRVALIEKKRATLLDFMRIRAKTVVRFPQKRPPFSVHQEEPAEEQIINPLQSKMTRVDHVPSRPSVTILRPGW